MDIVLTDDTRRSLKAGDVVRVLFRGQTTTHTVAREPRAFVCPETWETWWSIETDRGSMPLDRVTHLVTGIVA